MNARNPEFKNPGIAYTAKRLTDYAKRHGLDVNGTVIANAYRLATPKVLEHGPIVPPYFEASRYFPSTIPLIIGRLAAYDTGFLITGDDKDGIFPNSCRWLRLLTTDQTQDQLDEILPILGARPESGVSGEEQDPYGFPAPFTKHYYMESDQFAVKVIKYAPGRNLGYEYTGVELALPDIELESPIEIPA